MLMSPSRLGLMLMLVGALFAPMRAFAQPPRSQPASGPLPLEVMPPAMAAQAQAAIDRGLAFLKSRQDKNGGWSGTYGPAVSAIVTQAFAADAKHGPKHAIVRRALVGILRYEQRDGGIYERRRNLANYQTTVVLMLLAKLDEPVHAERIKKAQAFLTRLQYDDGEKIGQGNPWYGGAGYNDSKRPDLSNTQMMIQALHDSGLSKDDPVYRRAVAFISRCQLNGTTNDQRFARGTTDGGFIYSPNAGGESKASERLQEGTAPLRSYGSMTYAGFKSMLFANVPRDDERITACLAWIRRHYTLDSNPNMPGDQSAEGVYYYYHVFAKALDAWGDPILKDAKGVPHHWRSELCRKLASLQREDGSWVNDQPRWLEGDASYVTGLTILTLQTALDERP